MWVVGVLGACVSVIVIAIDIDVRRIDHNGDDRLSGQGAAAGEGDAAGFLGQGVGRECIPADLLTCKYTRTYIGINSLANRL